MTDLEVRFFCCFFLLLFFFFQESTTYQVGKNAISHINVCFFCITDVSLREAVKAIIILIIKNIIL